MNNKAIIEQLISKERIEPYLKHHNNNYSKAISHYKSNILISESFYPLLAILEVSLRNSLDYQLTNKFNSEEWYASSSFQAIAGKFQTLKIEKVKTNILKNKKELSHGRVVAELSFGFWTSLFDVKFEMSLWKNLRLAFPNCPKANRKRRTMSSKFNAIRKLRNRIFHHEAISWDLNILKTYKEEIMEGLAWLNKDLTSWVSELDHIDQVVFKCQNNIGGNH